MDTFTSMMPVGYRFAPTDEELIKNYLANKVFYRPLPAKIIQEIDASFLFSRPPNSLGRISSSVFTRKLKETLKTEEKMEGEETSKTEKKVESEESKGKSILSHVQSLVSQTVGDACEREWFFFIYQDEYFRGKIRKIRTVENGAGFWRCIGDEEPIYNSNGDALAFKIHLTYFSGSLPNAKKTHWRMEEYRLRTGYKTEEPEAEWILGRIVRGRDYNDS